MKKVSASLLGKGYDNASAFLLMPVVNALWFNGFWLVAVLGRTEYIPILCLLLGVHIIFCRNKIQEAKVIFLLAILGCVFDSILVVFNVLIFEGKNLIPVWLVLLWMGFSASLNRCLKFFQTRFYLSVLLGGFGGASSYWTGSKFGAVQFGFSEHLSVGIIFVVWCGLFPLLVFLSRFLREAIQ